MIGIVLTNEKFLVIFGKKESSEDPFELKKLLRTLDLFFYLPQFSIILSILLDYYFSSVVFYYLFSQAFLLVFIESVVFFFRSSFFTDSKEISLPALFSSDSFTSFGSFKAVSEIFLWVD